MQAHGDTPLVLERTAGERSCEVDSSGFESEPSGFVDEDLEPAKDRGGDIVHGDVLECERIHA